jgi:multicomponent Na+:H+ antiporter subunit E
MTVAKLTAMMMTADRTEPSPGDRLRAVVLRALGFSALWLVLSGADAGGLPAGAVAVAAATWASLTLSPIDGLQVSPAAIGQVVLRFLYQSAIAGTDVARRALDPRLPLRPGFLTYPAKLPRGALRNTFCTLSSLLPGTVPAGSNGKDALLIHCLDVDEPVVEQLGHEEELLKRALGVEATP